MRSNLPTPALSDAGMREHLMACMVEELFTGQVSLDLNALFFEVWAPRSVLSHQIVLTPWLAYGL